MSINLKITQATQRIANTLGLHNNEIDIVRDILEAIFLEPESCVTKLESDVCD